MVPGWSYKTVNNAETLIKCILVPYFNYNRKPGLQDGSVDAFRDVFLII